MESEELQNEISDKLPRVQTFIDLHNRPRNTSSTPIKPTTSESAYR